MYIAGALPQIALQPYESPDATAVPAGAVPSLKLFAKKMWQKAKGNRAAGHAF